MANYARCGATIKEIGNEEGFTICDSITIAKAKSRELQKAGNRMIVIPHNGPGYPHLQEAKESLIRKSKKRNKQHKQKELLGRLFAAMNG